MKFGIGTCAMPIGKRGKRRRTEGIKLPNQDKVRKLGEKETYKYLGILEVDTIKHVEMKGKIKRIPQENEKVLETKLHWRNFMKRINIWAVPLVRYSEPFLKCIREKLQKWTRKLMTMHEVLYSRDYIDRLYVLRKEGRRELTNLQDSVLASIRHLEDCIKKSKERLITVARNNTDNTRINRTFTRKQTWEERQLYGHFKQQTSEIPQQKTWTWLRKGKP